MGTDVDISIYESLTLSELTSPPAISGPVIGHTGWLFQDYVFTVSGTGTTSPLLGAQGTVDVTLGGFELTGEGEQGEYGEAAFTMPSWSVSATGLTGHAAAGDADYSFSIDATLVNGYLGTAEVTINGWEISAEGGGYSIALTYPPFEVSAEGLTGLAGTADLTYSFSTLTATGTPNLTGTIAAYYPPYSVDATLAHGKAITGEITVPGWIISADGVAGGLGTAELTWGDFSVSVTLHFSGTGTGTATWPSFLLDATGLVDIIADLAAATAAYTTYAMNTTNMAPTMYSSFGFNSYARIGGSYYGANSTGIYKLEGTTDGPSATAISAIIEQARIDGKSNKLKRPLEAFVGLRSTGHFNIEMTLDDRSAVYSADDYESDPHTVRVKFGKGLKGRYLGFKITNIEGSDLQIGDIEIPLAELGRKDR